MFGKSMRLGAARLQPSLEMALWLLGLFRKLRFDRASQGFNQVLCQEFATVERHLAQVLSSKVCLWSGGILNIVPE